MYGNLEEIQISDILRVIELSQKSGVLLISNSSPFTPHNKDFIVFCNRGKITYVADNNSFNLVRIYDFLCHYDLENSLGIFSQELISSSHIPEYEAILLLGQEQIISNHQAKKILHNIINESLFQLLLVSQGSFIWQENYQLQPQIIRFSINLLLNDLIVKKKLWQEYYPYIYSVNQCPMIQNQDRLTPNLKEKNTRDFLRLMDGKTSLIQISRYLNQDLIDITKAIFLSVENGWITLSNSGLKNVFPIPTKRNNFYVVYITKDVNWTSTLTLLLKDKNYDLLVINDLGEGFNKIFELNPSLILLEMDNFNIEGDYFCHIIKKHENFTKIPIIVITNHYQFISNLKHKLLGVTEYITKSAITKDLINIIEKYISPLN